MAKNRKLTFLFGFISLGLLATLLIKLTKVPGGIILPGFYLGGMVLVLLILLCLMLAGILKLIFKKSSFLTILFITTTVSFLLFHYQLYSPTLTIKVPNGYRGEISLVLSNLKENQLTVDSNGIGYLNKWTFNKTYSKPIVIQMDGKNLEPNLAGFNSSTFFGTGKSCCIDGKQIQSLSFEIAPDDSMGKKQYYSKSLTDLVDKKRVLLLETDEYTVVQTEAFQTDSANR